MNKVKARVFLICLALVLTITVGGTVAFMIANGGSLHNIFKPSNVSCTVIQDHTVANTGDINAYIRAMVVVTWEDPQGNIYAQAPSYTVTLGDGWFKGSDGYFYYENAVAPNATTSCVYANITVNGTEPTDAEKIVTVVAQAVQSVPDTVVEQIWPAVNANNGKLTSVTGGGSR